MAKITTKKPSATSSKAKKTKKRSADEICFTQENIWEFANHFGNNKYLLSSVKAVMSENGEAKVNKNSHEVS